MIRCGNFRILSAPLIAAYRLDAAAESVTADDLGFYTESDSGDEMAECPDRQDAYIIRTGYGDADRRQHTVFYL